MPIPRNWVEELVIEWLRLDGFLVEANLPIKTTPKGGRNEADVVGARIKNGKLEIRHIEVGQFAQGKKGVRDSIEKKFSKDIQDSIKKYFKKILSPESDEIEYSRYYVVTYWTTPTIWEAKNMGVTPLPLPDFIREEVLSTIKKWKKNPPYSPKIKNISGLPESYWLLKLIEYLDDKNLLNTETKTRE